MAGIATDLLPGDAELARRAAGGDGAAFVYLYDRYSADVFAACLTAIGEVEAAADATQSAFLKLLRRPPAMGAPDGEVAQRLHALALGTAADGPPMSRRAEGGRHAPFGAGVGWLRSETVAKAGARFDDDWSVHLSEHPFPRTAERVASATPLPVQPPPAPAPATAAKPLSPLPPLRSASKPRARRRSRPAWLALPAPAVAASLLLLALLAGGAGIVLTSGGTRATEPVAAGTGFAKAQAPRPAHRPERARADGRRAAAWPVRLGRPSEYGIGSPGSAAHRQVVRLSRGVTGLTNAGARLRAVTRRTGSGSPQAIQPLTRRTPAAVEPPAPPAPAPAPAPPPAPVAQPPAQTTQPEPAPPAPEPAPTSPSAGQGNHGTSRNCNSKKSPEPC